VRDAHKASAVPPEGELWYGLFFGANRIGFASIITHHVRVKNEPAVQVQSLTQTTLKLLGVEVSEEISQTDTFRADGTPMRSIFSARSNGHGTSVDATFTPTAVKCLIGQPPEQSVKVVPIPKGVSLGSSDDMSVNPEHLRAGATWSEYYFDPATLAIEQFKGAVRGHASVDLDGKAVKAWQVNGHTILGDVNMFVNNAGDMLRMEMALGIHMVKETREAAHGAIDYHPTDDLAEMGSVKVDAPIENPREVVGLRLTISKVPADIALPSGDGQTATRVGPGAWDVRIVSTEAPAGGPKLPETEPAADLASTPELTSKNVQVATTARQIVGGERSAAKAVALLHDWVNVHMRARYDIGVLRSGEDILQQPEGVCRDYAVLYTTLARAVGIPTRICAGMVFWQNRFYYHAWAESFVGRWVRVDATLPGERVDATHVTLARGDARAMYQVSALVGSIEARVLKVEYDPHMAAELGVKERAAPAGEAAGKN